MFFQSMDCFFYYVAFMQLNSLFLAIINIHFIRWQCVGITIEVGSPCLCYK
jgi:hypothetical protein